MRWQLCLVHLHRLEDVPSTEVLLVRIPALFWAIDANFGPRTRHVACDNVLLTPLIGVIGGPPDLGPTPPYTYVAQSLTPNQSRLDALVEDPAQTLEELSQAVRNDPQGQVHRNGIGEQLRSFRTPPCSTHFSPSLNYSSSIFPSALNRVLSS